MPVSALSGENVGELLATLKRMLPESPALMSPDEYTDQTERMIAEEIVREKIFLKMRQEIPFSTAVKVEKFEDDEERKLKRIAATVVVDRESHKGMLIGAGGATLKEIGTAARLELEEILGCAACFWKSPSRSSATGPAIRASWRSLDCDAAPRSEAVGRGGAPHCRRRTAGGGAGGTRERRQIDAVQSNREGRRARSPARFPAPRAISISRAPNTATANSSWSIAADWSSAGTSG